MTLYNNRGQRTLRGDALLSGGVSRLGLSGSLAQWIDEEKTSRGSAIRHRKAMCPAQVCTTATSWAPSASRRI
jgi:hypothetical protein